MGAITQVGCIVCRLYHYCETPAEVHHLEGKTTAGCHFKTIPLCVRHHRHSDNQTPPRWLAYHGDKKAFIQKYGDGEFLISATETIMEALGIGSC
jgi:hypothetical protein